MKEMPCWKKRLYVQGVIIGVLVLTAVALLGEVARQNWHTKVTAYPTKTEAAVESRAREIMDTMSLEEKVGQLFLIRCDEADAADVIARYHPGGLFLDEAYFSGTGKGAVAEDTADWQEAAEIPLLLAVNEEGGALSPVSGNQAFRAAAFLSPRESYTTGGLSLVISETEEKCVLLTELGLNMNLAPVADVTTDPNGSLYDRSLGRDGENTGRYVRNVIGVMNEQGVVGVLKHFPGYGNMTELSDSRVLSAPDEADLQPFREGISEGAPVVMVGHMEIWADGKTCPAWLSKEVHKLLRRDLGFTGVVMADDLTAMEPQAAAEAIRAGCDLLLTANYADHISAVYSAVQRGELSGERIDEAVLRVLKLKIQFNIL